MKAKNTAGRTSRNLNLILARAFLIAGFLLPAAIGLTQTAPYLTAVPTGTNQLLITITNAGPGSYELWTTPILGDTANYPWTVAAVGTNGQSAFVVPVGLYPAGFYLALLDTNAIPLWQAANPTNQSLGILAVTIDNPTNGASLQ
jgi:hypothetical protein